MLMYSGKAAVIRFRPKSGSGFVSTMSEWMTSNGAVDLQELHMTVTEVIIRVAIRTGEDPAESIQGLFKPYARGGEFITEIVDL